MIIVINRKYHCCLPVMGLLYLVSYMHSVIGVHCLGRVFFLGGGGGGGGGGWGRWEVLAAVTRLCVCVCVCVCVCALILSAV